MNESTPLSTVKSMLTGRKPAPVIPGLGGLHFPASSQTSFSVPLPRIETEDDRTITWLQELKEPELTGACVLDGRPAVDVGNRLTVDNGSLELCQDCYGKPLSVVLLQLANLNRRAQASMPAPTPRQ